MIKKGVDMTDEFYFDNIEILMDALVRFVMGFQIKNMIQLYKMK